MAKLQMAAHAIGDVEALLQGADVGDGDDDVGKSFEDQILKLVLATLAGKDVDNAAKLEQMRATVEEKLHETLEQRLTGSFKVVSDQLEQVFRGLGEMQTLATGVGDLKRMMTNVKARGAWGEVTLGNILEHAMAADQYEKNVEVRPGSNQRVEFAIKLPGGEGGPLWLPIDAKFPTEDYERLVDASERGDVEAVEISAKAIEMRIRHSANEISSKYIHPPYSTDFAILFLPTEGLYAEIIRRPGLADSLQRDCRIIITGPTTLLALLNSLRMGFRTLAIQKRSSEVWQILGAVKGEFAKYGTILEKVQKKLQEASSTIDDVAVRRRQIDRKLRSVDVLPEMEAEALLGVAAGFEVEQLLVTDPLSDSVDTIVAP
jgi:DNA recombination protein RmuC